MTPAQAGIYLAPLKMEARKHAKYWCDYHRVEVIPQLFTGATLPKPYPHIRQCICHAMHLNGHSVAEICRTLKLARGTVRHGIGRVMLACGEYDCTIVRQYMLSRRITVPDAVRDANWTIRVERLVALADETRVLSCGVHNVEDPEDFYDVACTERSVVAARHYAAYVLSEQHGVPVCKISDAYGMSNEQVIYGVGKFALNDGKSENKYAKMYRARKETAKRFRDNMKTINEA